MVRLENAKKIGFQGAELTYFDLMMVIEWLEVLYSARKTLLKACGRDPKNYKVHQLEQTMDLYVAFSSDTDPNIIDQLQNTLESLKKQGFLVSLYKTYGFD